MITIENKVEEPLSMEMATRLKQIKHIALDMDGTIYNGSSLFPFNVTFLIQM